MEIGEFSSTIALTTTQRAKNELTSSSATNTSLSLQEQVQQLSFQMQELMKISRGRENFDSRRSRSSTPHSYSRERNKNDTICWFHKKFGIKARNCREPCSFKRHPKN